jgi:pyridoxine 4-dehydrogenase
MAALAFTSAVAPAALGRARRGARAGAARRAASVRAGTDVSPDVDDDSTRSRRDDPDASTSRRGLLLGAGGLAVATTPGLILPGGASASPASSRVTLAALNQKRSVENGSAAGISGSSASSSKSRYVAWSGSERNTVVGDGALSLSPMGVGTWSWGNQFVWGYDESNDPVLERVFDRAVDAGVNLFDTADSYGTGNGLDGRSEVLLGEFLKRYPEKSERFSSSSAGDAQRAEALKRRSEVNIASKFAPYPWRVTPGSITNAAKESAARLGVDQIQLGQLHWSTGNYQPLQERALWAGIADAYDQGIIKAVGLSNYGPKQLKRVAAYMKRRDVPIATLQVQYHLLSRFPETNGTRETCDELGIRLIAYSPLGLGLLTGKYSTTNPPPGLRGFAYKDVLPALPELLGTMKEIGDVRRDPKTGVPKTPAQIALNWCLCKDTTPIPGAKTLKQLDENLGALGWRLSEAEVAALDDAAARAGKSTSQNIFQTG